MGTQIYRFYRGRFGFDDVLHSFFSNSIFSLFINIWHSLRISSCPQFPFANYLHLWSPILLVPKLLSENSMLLIKSQWSLLRLRDCRLLFHFACIRNKHPFAVTRFPSALFGQVQIISFRIFNCWVYYDNRWHSWSPISQKPIFRWKYRRRD